MSEKIHCPCCKSDSYSQGEKENTYICNKCGNEFTSRPLNIFFSYGHDGNQDIVCRIKSDLEKRGHTIWIDKKDIVHGDDWRRKITEGITGSQGVLAFLSEHTVREPGVCRDELGIAVGVKHGYIKTVLLEDEKSVTPPAIVTAIQWLDMHDWKDIFDNGDYEWEKWYHEKLSDIINVIESDETVYFNGEIEELKDRLGINKLTLSDTKEHELLKTSFVGRKWILNDIEKWRSAERRSRAFILYGGPGVGKSRLSAYLLLHNPYAAAGIYCEYDKDTYNNADSIARILAFKLAARLPDYRLVLLKILRESEGISNLKSPNELFDKIIINPLIHQIDGNRERMFIVIDGLDEAGKSGGNVLAETLRDIVPKFPSWLGILVTSRPDKEVTDALSGFYTHVLNAGSEENLTDIRKFFEDRLCEPLRKYSDAEKEHILSSLVKSSEGCFLYAHEFSKDVLENNLDLSDIGSYPIGMNGFYMKNFQRRFADKSEFDAVSPILSILTASGSLPQKLFYDVLSEQLDKDEDDVNFLLKSLGSFVVYGDEDGNISIYHKSLADWLADKKVNTDYFVSTKKGGKLLAEYALERIGSNKIIGMHLVSRDRNVGKYGDALRYDLAKYFIKAEMYDELDVFLNEGDTPLFPYFCIASDEFQEYHDSLVKKSDSLIENPTQEGADDLDNAGYWYSEMFRFDDAEKMFDYEISVYRKLSVYDEDSYQPELAVKLYNLGVWLQNLNRFGNACNAYEEALEIYSRLADKNPETYEHDVAMTFNNLGNLYIDTNMLTKSETAHMKALKIRSRLADKNPEAYEPDVAMTLNNLGNLYSDTNRLTESETAYRKALEIYSRLADKNPEAYEPDVAMTLNNLGNLYSDTNRLTESETAYRKALEIRSRLADRNPKAYEPDVATTLNNLGNLYFDTNRLTESETAYRKALEIYSRLADKNPEVYEPYVATTLNNLGTLYSRTNMLTESETAYRKALKIRSRLADKNPEAYEPDVAMTLINLGNLYFDTNRLTESETASRKALEIYSRLVDNNPEAYEPNVAMTLNNLGNLYSRTNMLTEAEKCLKKALEIRSKLRDKNPEAYEPDVAMTLNNLGLLYCIINQLTDAKTVLIEALEIFRRLADKNPWAYEHDVARTLNILSLLYKRMNEPAKAQKCREEAERYKNQ